MKELSIEEKAKRYDEVIPQLKGLLDGIHEEKCDIMEEDILEILPELKESEDEQKPAWSEEDEETLKILDRDLQEFYSRRKAQAGSPLFESQMQNVRWLKSIKDRYTWKPSDEQIKAFENFVRGIWESCYDSPYENKAKLLYSLLEQLKKLK